MIDSLKVEARNFRNLSIFRKTKGESLEFPMTQDVSQVMRIEQNLSIWYFFNNLRQL